MESQMEQNEIEDVGKTLQSAYDEYYDDSLSGWRETGAKVKAKNIESVCRGQSYEKVLECGAGEGSNLRRSCRTLLRGDRSRIFYKSVQYHSCRYLLFCRFR